MAMYGGLRDNAEVIGVSAAGRHRAYVLQALLRPDSHVVNDLLDNVPFTVTYCDLSDCVRVFTAPQRGRPLDIAVGGSDAQQAKKMLLRIGSTRYWQDTGLPLKDNASAPFPYVKTHFERTTWGKWRKAHPDTDVYVGKEPFPTNDPTIRQVIPVEPDEGVQCRLRADKVRWGAKEVPYFQAGIRNTGKLRFFLTPTKEACELEIDGRRLEWGGRVAVKPSTLSPGGEFNDMPIGLGQQWRDKKDKSQLHLPSGKHSVRVVFILKPVDGGKPLQVLTNSVDLEILAPGLGRTKPPSENKEK
jgi:hypothetical protein